MASDAEIKAAAKAYFGVREQQSECPDDHPRRNDQDYWDEMAFRAALEAAEAIRTPT